MRVARNFLGLDLAWSPRNPSGVAELDADGAVVESRGDLVGDDEILAWVRGRLAATTLIGIDMPTIVRNVTGRRRCEAELQREFARQHAGPHPANLARFPDGGRARRLLDELSHDGVRERIDLRPKQRGRSAFEVYPHPALVRLFAQPHVYKYKKKSRPWESVLAEWSRLRSDLGSLASADPPLRLDEGFPLRVEARGYKRWEDRLDAVVCAYVAAFIWRWGMGAPHVRVYGDLDDGYVVVPDRAAVSALEASGTVGP